MAKQNQERPARQGPVMKRTSGMSEGALRAVTMVGMAILLGVTGMNWLETRQQRDALGKRLTSLESQVTALGTKIDNAVKPQQRAQGPDPNKVYPVKTDGAPSLGPATAPITIAEFSDFQ